MKASRIVSGWLVTATLAWAAGAWAQAGPTAGSATWSAAARSAAYSEVTGRIVSVDHEQRAITLDNGMRLVLPERFQTDWGLLKPGAYVRAQVRPEGGDLVASALDVGTAPMASSAGTPVWPPASATAPGAPAAQPGVLGPAQAFGHVTGRVADVSQVITLEDGTRLWLGEGAPAGWRIMPGSHVQAQYRVVNGERVITALDIGPVPGSPAGVAGRAAPVAGDTAQSEIVGRIQSVSPSRDEVTLDNGVTLRIPSDLAINWDRLGRGAYVKATYRPQGGQNVVTAMQINPSPGR